jgi:hypothetical protein
VSARPLPIPINPALLKHADPRRQHLENRIADTITRFAGSMLFVYLHIIWFAAWIILGVEHYPYGLLTMIVSLEANFLSTFVMISQNRADEKRQVLADYQWQTVQEEDQQTSSCCSSPTRFWSSPRPSTPWTPPGHPPARTAPSRYLSRPKQVAMTPRRPARQPAPRQLPTRNSPTASARMSSCFAVRPGIASPPSERQQT